MNKKNYLAIYVIFITCCLTTQLAKAQWQNLPSTGGNTFNQTNPANNEESAGIGDFTLSAVGYPLAAFHINTNLFFNYLTPPSYPIGDVFMTDAPTNGNATTWQMLHGGTLRGTIYNAGDRHFRVQADDGDLIFHAYGSNSTADALSERVRITNGDFNNQAITTTFNSNSAYSK